MMFQGKTAVITGAGHGIGRTLALGFAEQGATVEVHYANSEQGANEVAALIQQRGGRALLARADLRQAAEVAHLVEQAHEQLGAIDIWINNAGASANATETRGMSEDDILERLVEVDIMGTWRCCREVERYMSDGGCILNTGWNGALAGAPGFASQMYAISKGAIISLTRCLAVEFAPRIRVNCIAPGYIENDWSRSLSTVTHQRLIHNVPLQRWGTAEDILGTALFLASPAAAYITGQVIVVDGGEVRR
jgi:3-oxoacyl-[acyl-carrier protein] reductase